MFVSYGLGDYFFFSAARFLGVPGSLAIASIYPVWTVTLGVLIQGNQIAPIQVAGLLAVVAGIVGVILGDPAAQKSLKTEHPKPPRHAWIGFTLAIGASVCWATNSFAVSRAGAEVSPLIGNSIRMFFALGITTVMRFLMAPQAPVWVGWKEFKSKSWVFFLEAFGGSLFFLYGLAHSSLLVGTTLSSLSPVIALPIAVLLKIEKLTWIRSLGVVFTVIGVTLILIR
jgi:drug/metabolite transporter (DMT)-like permease